jgi:Plavaka transposase
MKKSSKSFKSTTSLVSPSLVTCRNPFCSRYKKKPFSTSAAFTNHIDRSPGCLSFLVLQARSGAPHGASLVGNPKHRHEDGDAAWTSNKRPAILRRHMVNDAVAASGTAPVVTLAQHPNLQFVGAEDITLSATEVVMSEIGKNEFDSSSVVFNDGNDEDDLLAFEDQHTANGNDLDVVGAPSFHSNFTYTTDQKWTVSLLKILDEANAPDYLFGQVLEWARLSSSAGCSFRPVGGLSRAKNVDALIKCVRNANQLLPFVRRVNVPHASPSDVVCFDFVPQLLSLLQNRTIMIQDNLLININDPLKRYESKGNILGDAISGSVYRKAYDRLITDPTRQLFVPIIQWIDRTHVTGNSRFSLKPYMFTPAIFTEKFRRSIKAWGYHGFLPKRKSSSAQNQVLHQGDNIRNYHAELDAALESFRECSPRLQGVFLPIGPSGRMKVDIVTCLLFVIQDMQEGDMLCGRYGTHTSGVQRHCRSCDVGYNDLDDFNNQCKYVLASDMVKISQSDHATRTEWSQHSLDNAFNRVVFADPERGIFGATPFESMHAFRKGVVENVTLLVLNNVPPSKKAAFDNLAIAFHMSHRQTHRKEFPATDFSNGITNLKQITASERLGLVFLFVILFQYDEGWQIIQSCLSTRTNKKVPEVLQVFESILCFDAWLNKSHYWETSDPESVAQEMAATKSSIRKFMEMCKEHIPIEKETAWKKPKFHELLHVVDDMERYGSPVNFCAQRPESLLIPAAKRPGRRSQKRHIGSAYELQSAQRLTYSFIIDSVHTRIWESDMDNNQNSLNFENNVGAEDMDDKIETSVYQGTDQATFGRVRRILVGNKRYQYEVEWETRTRSDFMKLPVELLKFVCDSFEDGETIRFCTEYRRDVHKFRCHPSYQSDGAMYDWMNIDFGEEHGHFPCRLALVIVLEAPTDPDEKYQLVVQSTTRANVEHESTLLREWDWSPEYLLVSGNSVSGPCFVISISHNSSKVLETKPYASWAENFT